MTDYADMNLEKKLAMALEKAKGILAQYHEPIAIIGLSCRFPGARNAEEFWTLLQQGKNGIQEIPSSRWNIDTYYDADPEAPGKMITRKGGFIQEIDQFDAAFFGISPREAHYLDPQQRLLLEHTWSALEHANITPSHLKGSSTGVFIGIATQDYHNLLSHYGDPKDINAYMGTGNALSTATGRISYTLDLQGPNMAIETACSSSLVALHEACKSLQRGESDLAITGGVSALLSPELFINFSKAGMLAPDGKCKTFDAKANGYVRGEGCGIIILKRLSDAQRDQDTILAVIKASGLNQDGASSGLTVPNGDAQEKLLNKVLAQAKLKPTDIDYVECHGTGTPLGDPIEVRAIGAVYGVERDKEHPLKLSSVKTNIGHLEAAAGIASLIKVVLALQHQEIPRTLHFQQLNPHIELDFPAEIVTERTHWESAQLRRAGVSSFGFSGTNAHVILEEAPPVNAIEEQGVLPLECLFVLSAKTRKSLEQLVATYSVYLATTKDSLANICYTAATGRSAFKHRLALKVRSKEELIQALNSPQLVYHEVSVFDERVSDPDLTVLYSAYLEGKNSDWSRYYASYLGMLQHVNLPTYCFDKQRYWLEMKKKSLSYGTPLHDLLGSQLPGYGDEVRFLNLLSAEEHEYLQSHAIFEEILVPGAGFIESALAAGWKLKGGLPIALSDVNLLMPLRLALGASYDYQVSIKPAESGYEGRIDASVHEHSEWNNYATFRLSFEVNAPAHTVDLTALKADKLRQDISRLYFEFDRLGFNYGPEFQVISEAYTGASQALVLLRLHENLTVAGYCMHPALLDGAFQAIALLIKAKSLYIPFMVDSVLCYRPLTAQVWVEVTLLAADTQTVKADLALYDEQGELLGLIKGLRARATSQRALHQLINHVQMPQVYMEGVDSYMLPEVAEVDAAVMLYAQEHTEVILNAPPNWQRNPAEDVDWSEHHVVVVYHGDLSALMALTQRALRQPPRSMTLSVSHAFRVADEVIKVEPMHHAAIGLWRTFSQEAGQQSFCYLIDSALWSQVPAVINLICQKALPEPELILRDNQTYVPRLYHEEEFLNQAHRLSVPKNEQYLSSRSGIDTLHWAQRPEQELGANQLRIRIGATGLNFRDVLNAMDLYPGEAGDLGYEGSGEVLAVGREVSGFKEGDRVLVIGQGLFGSEVIVESVQACLIPDSLSLSEGAALPIVFLTAHYGLNELANLKRGQKVLIHAATGGVGLASIALARRAGAEIYASASQGKQSYLRDILGIKHVYDSRSTQFGAEILADTGGTGVDVVLNSLTSDGFIAASLSCLKEGGIFLEIGKLNIYSQEQMHAVRPDVTYHVIEIDKRMATEPVQIQSELGFIMGLFSSGCLKALPVQEFSVTHAIEAFHYLQEAKHIGKVVVTNPAPFSYKSDASYLITGGTGGLGFVLAGHLLSHGVKHLVLTSRSAASDSLLSWIEEQHQAGIDVRHYQADVADEKALSEVFASVAASPYPLKGIFHAAGLLRDGLLMNLGVGDLQAVLAPKVTGSQNLDKLSRSLDLDCLVFFSSIASLLGSPGQANYAAANAFMDGLALARHQEGLPALSINWGPFAAVGMAAHLVAAHTSQGILPLDAASAFYRMDDLLHHSLPLVGIMKMDWQKIPGQDQPYLNHLVNASSGQKGEWLSLLENTPAIQRKQLMTHKIKQLIADILHIQDVSQIDNTKNFFELGMDSLMAVDLKNKLQQRLGGAVTISNALAFDYASVHALRDYLLEQLHYQEADLTTNESLLKINHGFKMPERVIPTPAEPESELKTPLKYKNMFITGATGVLGGYFLQLILRDPKITPYCLVRANSEEEGKARLKEILKAYETDEELLHLVDKRVKIVLGDVVEPGLGLTEQDEIELANKIDVVIHSAGKVSLHGIYDAVAAVNVLGTKNMIDFTLKTKQKYILYVSSYSMMGDRTMFKAPDFTESDFDVGQQFSDLGYQQTKFEGETLIRQSKDQGIKYIIVRPGNIFGDSQTGVYPYLMPQLTGIFFDVFRTIIDTQTSILSNAYYDMTPVDYVAKGMLHLVTRHQKIYGTYHLVNTHQKTYGQIVSYIQECGYPIEIVNDEEYKKRIVENKFAMNGEPYHSKTLDLLYFNPNFLCACENTRIDAQFTHSVLAKANIICPEIDKKLLGLYLKKMKELGYLSH